MNISKLRIVLHHLTHHISCPQCKKPFLEKHLDITITANIATTKAYCEACEASMTILGKLENSTKTAVKQNIEIPINTPKKTKKLIKNDIESIKNELQNFNGTSINELFDNKKE